MPAIVRDTEVRDAYKMIRELKTGRIRTCELKIDEGDVAASARVRNCMLLTMTTRAQEIRRLSLCPILGSLTHSIPMLISHIIMSKNEPFLHSLNPPAMLLQPFPICIDAVLKSRPFDTADEF